MDVKLQAQVDELTKEYQRKLEATSMLVYGLQQYSGYNQVLKQKGALESQYEAPMAILGYDTIESAYEDLQIHPLI